MKGGDIDNVSSPQVICTTDVVIQLNEGEAGVLFLKKKEYKLGEVEMLNVNKLWRVSNNYGISLEMAGFEDQGWTEELLEKAFERLERRAVNPFNYYQLYSDVNELVGTLPYRPNLKAVIDVPGRVARYGSAGVQIDRI
jgi:hypothetical protein